MHGQNTQIEKKIKKYKSNLKNIIPTFPVHEQRHLPVEVAEPNYALSWEVVLSKIG